MSAEARDLPITVDLDELGQAVAEVLVEMRAAPVEWCTCMRPACEQPHKPSADRPQVLDLRERWLDVRRITRSRPEYVLCIRAGWDPNDLWLEVYARALARQSMASRYDPVRAGVGKYLNVLTGSILRNLLEQQRSAKARAEVVTDPEVMARWADPYEEER